MINIFWEGIARTWNMRARAVRQVLQSSFVATGMMLFGLSFGAMGAQTLPPVEVVGQVPSCGMGGVPVWAGNDFIGCTDPFGGFGSVGIGGGVDGGIPIGGAGPSVPAGRIPHTMKRGATCKSDELSRHLSAAKDAVAAREADLSGLSEMRAVLVSDDDGGTEVWQVSSVMFSDPLVLTPVPGTLSCPSS